jgi:hypothetical protein
VAAAAPGLAVMERISFELDTGAVHDMQDVMTSDGAVEWENTLQGPVDSAAPHTALTLPGKAPPGGRLLSTGSDWPFSVSFVLRSDQADS